jgi:hypothetical protein
VLRRARRAHSCSRREMIGNCFSTVRGKSSRPGSASGRPTIHPVATVNATPSGRTYARLLVRWGFRDSYREAARVARRGPARGQLRIPDGPGAIGKLGSFRCQPRVARRDQPYGFRVGAEPAMLGFGEP